MFIFGTGSKNHDTKVLTFCLLILCTVSDFLFDNNSSLSRGCCERGWLCMSNLLRTVFSMKLLCVASLFLILQLQESVCFLNVYGKIKQEPITGDPGAPLFLTPLIEQGKIKQAQTAAEVNFDGFKKVKSYAGYLTVDKNFNSNLFFWYFPSATKPETSPVLLWLQGGPGVTSLIGLFAENGPFKVKARHGLKLRKYAWTTNHNVIYIDNPVGSGYSFTNDGYAQNETKVGEDLYNGLLQFFQLFPDLQKNEFYISGESYAGKYVPAIGYTIYKNNPSAKLKINLQGLTIGNGLSDPVNQLKYGDYLYQIGLIDSNALALVKNYEQEGIKYIQNKQWLEAFKLFDNLLNGDLINHTSLFKNITGFDNYYNYLISNDTNPDFNYMGSYIQRNDVRQALHVGNTSFNSINPVVEINLASDVMQSVAPWISELLSNYRILIYNGQLDIVVAYPLTVNYLKNLQFSGADVYKTAPRYQWWVDGSLAGYVKHAGNLTEVLVRNAGHMVPFDQPQWALDLITRFTYRKSYF